MLWWTLDHLAGGETTLEEAQAYWGGIVIEDDYGTAISPICEVGKDGIWIIRQKGSALTDQ